MPSKRSQGMTGQRHLCQRMFSWWLPRNWEQLPRPSIAEHESRRWIHFTPLRLPQEAVNLWQGKLCNETSLHMKELQGPQSRRIVLGMSPCSSFVSISACLCGERLQRLQRCALKSTSARPAARMDRCRRSPVNAHSRMWMRARRADLKKNRFSGCVSTYILFMFACGKMASTCFDGCQLFGTLHDTIWSAA